MISLTVNDGKVNSAPDTVTITATSNIVRRYVNANANGANTGLTPDDAYTSIDYALYNLLQLGEGQSGEIIVSNGTYTRNGDAIIPFNSYAIIPLGWMLKGESKEGVIINGGDYNLNNKGIIINFTFSNYGMMAPGGAIFNDGGTVKDCIFSSAWADADGAGIYNKGGTVSNCIFENLGGECGGGCPGGDNDVDGSAGGGVYNENGTVSNCTFTDCHAYGARWRYL